MAFSDTPSPKPVWSPEARTAASLVIFVHLFALVVAVTTYTRPGPLQVRLHDLFALYLRNLHLTAYPVSYPFARFHLTHALPTDVDFNCQVEFQKAGGPEVVSIPSAGLQPPVRFRRYQALANATGTLADAEESDDFSALLPKSIAGSVLRSHGASQGVFRCRAHYLPEIESMGEVEAGRTRALENYGTIYEAQVLVGPRTVDVLRKSETLDVAPVEGGPGRRPPARRPNNSQRPGATQP
jgi:hypothetical protein